jgi:hypothetical protein
MRLRRSFYFGIFVLLLAAVAAKNSGLDSRKSLSANLAKMPLPGTHRGQGRAKFNYH